MNFLSFHVSNVWVLTPELNLLVFVTEYVVVVLICKEETPQILMPLLPSPVQVSLAFFDYIYFTRTHGSVYCTNKKFFL